MPRASVFLWPSHGPGLLQTAAAEHWPFAIYSILKV